MSKEACCSLCHKPRNRVEGLYGTDTVQVCDGCTKALWEAVMAARAKTVTYKETPRPKEIHAYLNQYVIGQEEAKRVLSVAVYHHFRRREYGANKLAEVEIRKSNCLILGPSGTGKTELARTLARMLDVPFYVGDATRLTSAGYVGDDAESLIQGLVQNARGDIDRAQWGIVFIDEVDKIRKAGGRGMPGYKDVSGEAVQQALLKIIEGGKVMVPRAAGAKSGDMVEFDTSNVLFLCGGSFAGIDEVVRERKRGTASLGFGAKSRDKVTDEAVYGSIEQDDLLEFGMIAEFLGRVPVVTSTLPLTEGELRRILTEPKNSMIRQKEALFAMDGIRVTWMDDALDALAAKASKDPTGARSLIGYVEAILRPYAYDLPGDPLVDSLTVTKTAVEGGKAIVGRKQEA